MSFTARAMRRRLRDLELKAPSARLNVGEAVTTALPVLLAQTAIWQHSTPLATLPPLIVGQ